MYYYYYYGTTSKNRVPKIISKSRFFNLVNFKNKKNYIFETKIIKINFAIQVPETD